MSTLRDALLLTCSIHQLLGLYRKRLASLRDVLISLTHCNYELCSRIISNFNACIKNAQQLNAINPLNLN